MPWRSYAERDAAVQAVKDAAAADRFDPFLYWKDRCGCVLGHSANAIAGVDAWIGGSGQYAAVLGLSVQECDELQVEAFGGPESAIAAMLAVPVGGEE